MKNLFFKCFLHLASSLLILFFTGCSSPLELITLNGSIDAWDIDSNNINRGIKTKTVNKSFALNIYYIDSLPTDEHYFHGRAGYWLYDNVANIKVIGTDDNISVDIDINATKDYIFNYSDKNVSVEFGVCVDKVTYTKSIILIPPFIRADPPYNYYLSPYDPNSGLCSTDCNDYLTTINEPAYPDCHLRRSSTDNFSVRPGSFRIVKADAGNLNSIVSATNLNLSITAIDSMGTSSGYTTSPSMEVNTSKYYKSATSLDDTGTMVGNSSLIINPTFINGVGTNMAVQFDEIGKVTIELQDRTWAAVDSDDTPQNCSPNGAYICGEINATFIPARFLYSGISLSNEAGSYTYFANNSNSMGAFITGNVLAVNDNNVTTQNYDTTVSWAKNIDLNITNVTGHTVSSNTVILDKTTFTNGTSQINKIDNLKFNIGRSNNIALNPTTVNISQVSLDAKSTDVTNSDIIDNRVDTNVTFLYARTNAPSYRFITNPADAFIYYEVYCSGNVNGVLCDKKLLPNGKDSNITNDPRWYINTLHTNDQGNSGILRQVNSPLLIMSTHISDTNIARKKLVYNGNIYPYKASLENNASSWLIYDRYNKRLKANQFNVEFESAAAPVLWSGSVSNPHVNKTKNTNLKRVNRRIMW